jgi:predicted component of viral defense system (DUF524 family)
MESCITWPEVYRIHAYREDLFNESALMLCFDHENGEFIEVDDAMPGFDEMLLQLGKHLALPPDFMAQVESTECDEDPITVYSRASCPQ